MRKLSKNGENCNIDKTNSISNDNIINYQNKKHNNINCFINKKYFKLVESAVSLFFIVNNFQICIENEITNSKILISTMELIIKNFVFYIPPILSSILIL